MVFKKVTITASKWKKANDNDDEEDEDDNDDDDDDGLKELVRS